MNYRIFQVAAVAVLCLFAGSGLQAEPGLVTVELNSAPPTEAVVFSFGDGEELGDDGWGWIGTEEEWRDMGMSFRSPADTTMQKITLHLQRVPMPFLASAKFNLRIYKTGAVGEKPDTGELVYEGKGELSPHANDRESYLTLILDQPVSLMSGAIYFFILSWEEAAPYQSLIFHVQTQYLDGGLWYQKGRDGELTYTGQTDRPGLEFYVQESQSQPTPKK